MAQLGCGYFQLNDPSFMKIIEETGGKRFMQANSMYLSEDLTKLNTMFVAQFVLDRLSDGWTGEEILYYLQQQDDEGFIANCRYQAQVLGVAIYDMNGDPYPPFVPDPPVKPVIPSE